MTRLAALLTLSLCVATTTFAQTPAAQTPPPGQTPAAAVPQSPNDYALDASWLCRPGRQDACSVDLATTIVKADGSFTREEWKGDPNAPIDCFYVYPTVSTDPTPFSDMTADPAELNVIRQQFARFGSVCRVYAPLYRQVTLAGLRQAIAGGGGGFSLNKGPQYDDVRDAWLHYLEKDNRGRGVVLIGHSQGSYILTELLRQEIDGKPVQSRLVSALLLGATFAVAERQGRWRLVATDPALSQACADRMRRDLRVVPRFVASTGEHAIRQGHRAWHGRGVHQPRRAGRGLRSAERVSRC